VEAVQTDAGQLSVPFHSIPCGLDLVQRFSTLCYQCNSTAVGHNDEDDGDDDDGNDDGAK